MEGIEARLAENDEDIVVKGTVQQVADMQERMKLMSSLSEM